MSMFDPEVEAGAIAVAWAARPARLFEREIEGGARLSWWQLLSDRDRDLYRYRASIVLEAVDELRSNANAAN